jgi:5-methylcytosine-specific restriction endonuclease McrA
MELRKYLRTEFGLYIRNKLIKDKCEYCGELNNLHLHHVDRFIELLHETLDELELQELDTHEYSKKELSLIKNIMLGKQIKIEYVTLCKSCHEKVHGDINKNNRHNPYDTLFLKI